jgi:hypothetical protein
MNSGSGSRSFRDCFQSTVTSACILCLLLQGRGLAASRTLKAGQVLGVAEDIVLSGDDVLVVEGVADKPCRLDGNGGQIRSLPDWTGWVKIKHCEFRGLGTAKKPALDLAATAAGDRIVIEHCEFHACGSIHLANEGSSAAVFRHNKVHASSMTPVTNLPSESPPGFRATGKSPARKLFQGNHIAKSVVLFENTGNWLIGGDEDQDSNLLIGMRASLSVHRSADMVVRGNYIHTDIPSHRWSQVHTLAVVSPCPNLVVEHNILRHGQWVVRGLTGQFRYNLVLDADAQTNANSPRSHRSAVALHHAFVALQQERLGRGVLLLAQQRSPQQAEGVIAQPVVGQRLLADGQAVPEEWLGRDVLLLLQQDVAQHCQPRGGRSGLRRILFPQAVEQVTREAIGLVGRPCGHADGRADIVSLCVIPCTWPALEDLDRLAGECAHAGSELLIGTRGHIL